MQGVENSLERLWRGSINTTTIIYTRKNGMSKKGNLSINSENLFPIIKKWLYSDHDIFVRELISNGSDAITKLKKLALMSEFQEPVGEKYHIHVEISAKDRTITFIDNGLGMTEQEVEEYITQIAFSGAKDFVEKYKDKTNDDQIIGHFGLGFYSAFMVADKVSIDTLSYQEGAKSVHWESDGDTEYEISDSNWNQRGTKITLYLNENSHEFSNEYRVREVLNKYCSFMPYEIFLKDMDAQQQTEEILEKELREEDTILETIIEPAKTEEKEKEDGTKEIVEVTPETKKYKIVKREVAINDTQPLWAKHPNQCTKEEYLEFYRKVFMDFKEPLFWIHLNMDYPFNLKGILYFPKINTEYDSIEGKIKLYNNQVFIADNIKEVIPEFLMLLKGAIDCPDLPLNVSRSALQNDGFVKKISDYISKKVADKLTGMCKTDRENYEKYWDDISPFIKYGCLKDEKFSDKINKSILFKSIYDNYLTLEDLKTSKGDRFVKPEENQIEDKKETEQVVENHSETESAENTAKEEKKEIQIYYVTDVKAQDQYITLFKDANKEAVILTHHIDTPFVSQLEQKNEGIKFLRIDADIHQSMKAQEQADEQEKAKQEELAKKVQESLNINKLTVKMESLANTGLAAVITVSEESRRMQDMMRQYAMMGLGGVMDESEESLVLNTNHPLVAKLNPEAENFSVLCNQLYDLAKLGHGSLDPKRMAKFIARTNEFMLKL